MSNKETRGYPGRKEPLKFSIVGDIWVTSNAPSTFSMIWHGRYSSLLIQCWHNHPRQIESQKSLFASHLAQGIPVHDRSLFLIKAANIHLPAFSYRPSFASNPDASNLLEIGLSHPFV